MNTIEVGPSNVIAVGKDKANELKNKYNEAVKSPRQNNMVTEQPIVEVTNNLPTEQKTNADILSQNLEINPITEPVSSPEVVNTPTNYESNETPFQASNKPEVNNVISIIASIQDNLDKLAVEVLKMMPDKVVTEENIPNNQIIQPEPINNMEQPPFMSNQSENTSQDIAPSFTPSSGNIFDNPQVQEPGQGLVA